MKRKTPEEYIDRINNDTVFTFVGWEGAYRGNRTKVMLRCNAGEHEITSVVTDVIDRKRGCPKCSGKYRRTPEEYIREVETKTDVKFLRWDGDFVRSASKAFVRCNVDGHEWSVRVNDIVNRGIRCPKCVNNYRYTLAEYIERVNKRDNCDNRFVRIVGKFKGRVTKIMMSCDVDGHQWITTFKNILGRGTGCPVCTNYGFDPDEPAMLYALRSRCGTMVKIGITNDYPRRYAELARATPFEFDKVEMLEGEGVIIQNLEKALHHTMKAVNFTESFNGHTEWMLWDPRLHDWFEFYRKLLNL